MTYDEADKIIAELNICFPSKKLLVEEVKRWEQNLLEYEYEDAQKAVKHIEDTLRFFPAWADFREALWPYVKERRRIAQSRALDASRALQAGPRTPEEAQRIADIIAEIKEKLSQRG